MFLIFLPGALATPVCWFFCQFAWESMMLHISREPNWKIIYWAHQSCSHDRLNIIGNGFCAWSAAFTHCKAVARYIVVYSHLVRRKHEISYQSSFINSLGSRSIRQTRHDIYWDSLMQHFADRRRIGMSDWNHWNVACCTHKISIYWAWLERCIVCGKNGHKEFKYSLFICTKFLFRP